MKLDSGRAKRVVLQRIAGDSAPMPCGNAKFRVRGKVVHTRYCSENYSAPEKYKFNVNPNTLSADYELWVCGDPDHYYLMPISLMEEIYRHPDAYVDRRRPEIRVVSVDAGTHRVTFARGGRSLDVSSYLGATLT